MCLIPTKAVVLLTGGSAAGVYLDSCEAYSVKFDDWKPIPAMNHGRHQHASCYIDGHAYVFCGYSRT